MSTTTSSRSTPRPTTKACVPISARAGRGAAARSAGLASPGAEGGEIRAIYVPMRHPDTSNFDPDQVYRWLKDLIAAGVRFITMNGGYDWGWLRTDGGILMPRADHLEEIGALRP